MPKKTPYTNLNTKQFTEIVYLIIKLSLAIVFFTSLTSGNSLFAIVSLSLILIGIKDGVSLTKEKIPSVMFTNYLYGLTATIVDALIILAFSFAGLVDWGITTTLLISGCLTTFGRFRLIHMYPNMSVPFGLLERTERMMGILVALILFALSPQKYAGLTILEIMFLVMLVLSVMTVAKRISDAYIATTE